MPTCSASACGYYEHLEATPCACLLDERIRVSRMRENCQSGLTRAGAAGDCPPATLLDKNLRLYLHYLQIDSLPSGSSADKNLLPFISGRFVAPEVSGQEGRDRPGRVNVGQALVAAVVGEGEL